jgi:crotonobetainyl-CoA:carnitine CoA-transferase CaiB-like acyl-CoA transferase
MTNGALAGISVLELGSLVAAPYCGKMLADLGAEVVKVEAPGEGDPARRRGPFPDDTPHPERSALFLYLNTSKRSITLDPTKEDGGRIFRELAAQVDVLIEDYPPGTLESLGLGYAELSRTKPGLVMTSITPFGQTGPNRDYRSHPLNSYHAGGQSGAFHVPQDGEVRPPPKGGGYLGEYDGGLIAAVGTLAAVIGRNRTGRGRYIDISKQEAMIGLERVDVARLANDPTPIPWRPATGGMAKTKDGYLLFTVLENHQWQGLMRAMGDPEWSKAEWCQTEKGRMEHADETAPHVQAWAAGLTRDEIYHRTQAEGSPSAPIRNVAEVSAWDQARARGFFVELDHPEAGEHVYPTAAYKFSKTPWAGTRAPLLGEHNREVYCNRLGYSQQELARLSDSGVI